PAAPRDHHRGRSAHRCPDRRRSGRHDAHHRTRRPRRTARSAADVMAVPAPRTIHLTTDDAVRLAVQLYGAGDTRVLLVPGTFSNHTFWLGTRGVGFARYLADHEGCETWSLDPRGHGASQRPGRREHWDFDDWARHDVVSAIRAA